MFPGTCSRCNAERQGAGFCRFQAVDPLERKDLLFAFMKKAGLFYLPADSGQSDHGIEACADLLKPIPVFEVSGGVDFDFASDKCLEFL